MPLSEKIEQLLVDSRLIEQNLKTGKLTASFLKKYLSNLDDLSNEHGELDVEELLEELRNCENDELSMVDSPKDLKK